MNFYTIFVLPNYTWVNSSMKIFFCFIAAFFFLIKLVAQNVNFEWAAHFGEPYWEKGNSITIDAAGDIYSTGYINSSVDFDPGPGVFTLPVTNNTHGFISKLDKNRNFIWAKQIEGVDVRGLSIKTDLSGNVIVLGTYLSNIDLDPGPGIFPGNPGGNIFIIKLNSSGDLIWGKTITNSSSVSNVTYALSIDAFANILITGTCGPQTDLDPGGGIYILPTISNGVDIFVLKLNANGDFTWAKNFGSQSSFDIVNGIASDASGAVYLTGVFWSGFDFDPGSNVYNISLSGNSNSAYILKLDQNGNFIWARHFDAYTTQSLGQSVSVDASGNVYVGGIFYSLTDFDPGPGVFNLTASIEDCFICKLDASGKFVWAKSFGSPAPEFLNGLFLDSSSNVYATGSFYLSTDFDPGAGNYILTSAGGKDVFVVKLDKSGEFVWAKAMGGTGDDIGNSIATETNGNSIYTIGSFENTADIDPGNGITNLTSLGFQDIFIQKLSKCSNSTFNTVTAVSCSSYILNNHQYDSSGTFIQIITNAAGCDSVITLNLTINKKFTAINASICQGQTYFAGGANQTVTGIYKDTLHNSLGCDSIITTSLVVHPNPQPNLGPDRNLCSNTPASISPGLFSTYLWQDNSSASTFTVTAKGKYWVTVSNAFNCKATDTLNVLKMDTIPAGFLPADKAICLGSSLQLSIPGYRSYLWSTGSTTSNALLNAVGKYWLTVTDNNNCTGSDSIVLTRNINCIPVSIPNAFTPNHDGLNDVFRPSITIDLAAYKLVIFNRYGEKVFETSDLTKGWDGTYKGTDQPRNAYVYTIMLKDVSGAVSDFKGTVTLVR